MDDDLRNLLLDERRKWRSTTPGRFFVPQHRIDAIMTDETVQKALKGYDMEPYELHQVGTKVIHDGKKTLAILIVIGRGRAIRTFVQKERYSDLKLPLEHAQAQEYIGDAAAADDFILRQWELIAPIFLERGPHFRLDDATILPFMSERLLDKSKQGSFGAIYETILPRSHVRALAATEEEVSASNGCSPHFTNSAIDTYINTEGNWCDVIYVQQQFSGDRNRYTVLSRKARHKFPSRTENAFKLAIFATSEHYSTLRLLYLQRYSQLSVPAKGL
jgi:hypothetical protein